MRARRRRASGACRKRRAPCSCGSRAARKPARRPRRARCRCRVRSARARAQRPRAALDGGAHRFRVAGSSGVWDNRRMTPQSRIWAIALAMRRRPVGLGAALLWRYSSPPIELATGTYLAPARALPDFSLIDQHGRAFRAAQSRRPLVAHVLRLHELSGLLSDHARHARGHGETPAGRAAPPCGRRWCSCRWMRKRDTPQQLAKYVPYFDPELHRRDRGRPADDRGAGAQARRGRGNRAERRAAATRSIIRARSSWSIRPARSPRS